MKNEKREVILLILKVLLLFVLPTIIFFIGIFRFPENAKIAIIVIYSVLIIALGAYLIFIIKRYLKDMSLSNKTLNQYIQNEVSQYGIGTIIFLNNGRIVWATDFVLKRFGKKIIGKNIKSVFGVNEIDSIQRNFKHKKDEYQYDVHVSFEKNVISIKDITVQENLLSNYMSQRVVFGELHIDNISLYQVILSQEEMYKIYSKLGVWFDDIAKKYDIIYHQYDNGRFFVLTTSETLSLFEKNGFQDFLELSNKKIHKNLNLTLSGGFAYGIFKFETLDKLSKDALLQSKTRGGNQITVLTKNEKPRFYGSTSEIDINMSRTNVAYITNILMNKLKSEEINKVIVYGHKFADLDALGSAWGIYCLAKGFKKQAYIQNKTFDETTRRVYNRLSGNEKQVFISPEDATSLNDKNTLVVICDTSDETRIENIQAFSKIEKENIIVIDHHRIGLNPEYAFRENLYIDSSSSSASEIVTEIVALSNNKDKIDEKAAQHLLNGIYLDTNNFQKQTSSKTFLAASLLQSWGAKISISVESLKMNDEIHEKIKKLLANLAEVKPGYFLAYNDNITVSSDIISMAADEILRVSDRKAAFVVGKLDSNRCKMSARGIKTNVQVIAEIVNGGGHFGSAAAETDEDMELFVDNIKQAIVSVKNESYND
ncbi:DHH family phosphoesterase [Mycoplasma enhydrae]|uniref:DHH family phosphoesterase n=1 Tax=Mycoplasma enhydrae TaxID=2499220 RepID=UPI00197C89ED|nr:DHH family phosphoesterase [Mycoplasma enhydrae]MBN4089212.1 DHH family phosphoesterase [Mycoplasma enhydrae]